MVGRVRRTSMASCQRLQHPCFLANLEAVGYQGLPHPADIRLVYFKGLWGAPPVFYGSDRRRLQSLIRITAPTNKPIR